ncbi:hypothetical protein PoB_002543900 [Plakobranchus ocellatus]|uniref:Uncharacterized protein n=1 Tax=Plakobranchus ocellatus TaxID=259542 RepID=A0AAV3ZYD6_9GAST|nr:hypothetical protein PoB_002543900 [Plakobranchus ocellatus]
MTEYPLGTVPWAQPPHIKFLSKPTKAVLMHTLEDTSALKSPDIDQEHIHIIDGNAVYHALHVPDLTGTFGELTSRIFCALPKVAKVHFLTENYREDSIKSLERIPREESQTFTVQGSSTKVPKVWKMFLMNGENKKQLAEFLLYEWQQDYHALMLLKRKVYFACDHQCFVLSNCDGKATDSSPVPYLVSSHEETDTLLILHAIYCEH